MGFSGFKDRIFYGWMIVATFCVAGSVIWGVRFSFGVFFKSLENEFGWSRTAISGAHSLALFLEGLFGIAVGSLTDKFGPRIVMVTSGLILGLGYSLLSQINNVWQLYFLYGVIVGMGATSGNVTLLSTTARWFIDR